MSQIVEINGIKMAIDERTATIQKVDTFKVGDPVKLLMKTYSGYESKYGIIAGFDQFKNRPTITVAYLDYTELKFVYIHQGSEHEILAVEAHDMAMEKTWILDRMQDKITKAEQELNELKSKKVYFENNFGKYFKDGTPTAANI